MKCNQEIPSLAQVYKKYFLHITELDISVFAHNDKRKDLKKSTREMLTLQRERYRDIFRIFREYTRNYISNVTIWGPADDHT